MPRAHFFRSRSAVVCAIALLALVAAKDVVENDDDGKPHLKYQVDGKNRKTGDYAELYPSGKIKIHGSYQADKKTGTWTTSTEDGKVLEVAHCQNDVLDGAYQYNFPNGTAQMKTVYTNGEISGPITAFDEKGATLFTVKYPMTRAAVQKAVDTWAPVERSKPKMTTEPKLSPPFEAGAVSPESQNEAMKYIQLYRLLSNLPTQMSIDPTLADHAQHGAVLLHDIGHLDHKAPKPENMDADFYKSAEAGTSTGNIAMGAADLFGEVDMYMDDSDSGNVARIGHRQWILTPGLQKTGFGWAGRYSVLSVFDGANHPSNFVYIAYPGEGYYPHFMLSDDAAWSLSISAAKLKLDKKKLAIKVTAVDDHFGVIESADAEIIGVPQNTTGVWPCIIFRPGLKQKGLGRYIVQVTGLASQSNQPQPLTYLVDVVDIQPVKETKSDESARHKPSN
jgi:hypothetical protein